MIWLFIIIDILILTAILFFIFLVLHLWNKRKDMNIGSLSEFRNDTIYEKSYEEQRRKAHIEEIIDEEKYLDDDPVEDNPMGNVFFSDGYGGMEDHSDEC